MEFIRVLENRENFMSKRKRFNRGEHPIIHVEETHEAIISKDLFDAVQNEVAYRSERFKKPLIGKVKHPFIGMLGCGICGGSYQRKEMHGRPVWTCGRLNTLGKSACMEAAFEDNLGCRTHDY